MRLTVAAALTLLATLTPSRAATCALIGDSIAEDLRGFFRECQANVKLGIGTKGIAALMPAHVDLIVVSAGSNDYLDPGLLSRLQAVRSRAGSARVIWIRPAPSSAGAAVDTVAHAHGDAVVPFVVSPRDRERLHPLSNQALAADIRRHFQRPGKDGIASRSGLVADLSAPGKATMRVHFRSRRSASGHGIRRSISHGTQHRADSRHAYR